MLLKTLSNRGKSRQTRVTLMKTDPTQNTRYNGRWARLYRTHIINNWMHLLSSNYTQGNVDKILPLTDRPGVLEQQTPQVILFSFYFYLYNIHGYIHWCDNRIKVILNISYVISDSFKDYKYICSYNDRFFISMKIFIMTFISSK